MTPWSSQLSAWRPLGPLGASRKVNLALDLKVNFPLWGSWSLLSWTSTGVAGSADLIVISPPVLQD